MTWGAMRNSIRDSCQKLFETHMCFYPGIPENRTLTLFFCLKFAGAITWQILPAVDVKFMLTH